MAPPHDTIIDELLDSNPRLDAVREQTPDELRHDAAEAATVASVRAAIERHAHGCPAGHKLHRWGKIACVMLGAVLALQVLIAGLGRSYLRDTVRQVLREEIGHMAKTEQPQWSPLVPSAFAKGPTP